MAYKSLQEKEAARLYRVQHSQERLEYNREYRRLHPEKVREWTRKYYHQDPMKYKERKKRWSLKNKEHCKEQHRKWYHENIEKARGSARRYVREHAQEVSKRSRKYNVEHAGEIRVNRQAYYALHAEKIREYSKRYRREHIERYRELKRAQRQEPRYAIDHRVEVSIRGALRGNKSGRRWESLVGYTLDQLMQHLESRFVPGMTWANMGEWHIDHAIPRSLWQYEKPEDHEFRQCWALSNLQPLWGVENIKKRDKCQNILQEVVR